MYVLSSARVTARDLLTLSSCFLVGALEVSRVRLLCVVVDHRIANCRRRTMYHLQEAAERVRVFFSLPGNNCDCLGTTLR